MNPLYVTPLSTTENNPRNQIIYIDDTQLDDTVLLKLIKEDAFRGLIQEITLSGCPMLTQHSLKRIPLLKNLVSIQINNVRGLEEKPTIQWEIQGAQSELNSKPFLPHVVKVDLSDNKNITDIDLGFLYYMDHLADLNLSLCPNLKTIPIILKNKQTHLTNINLSGCTGLSDKALCTLSHHTSIFSLNLAYCVKLSDADIMPLKTLTCLKELDLSGCSHITQEGLGALALPHLRKLSLAGCLGIGEGNAYIRNRHNLEKKQKRMLFDADETGTQYLAAYEDVSPAALQCIKDFTSEPMPCYLLGFKNLALLTFDQCENLMAQDLVQILKLPELKKLSLTQCYRLDSCFMVLLRDKIQAPSPLIFLRMNGNATLSGQDIKTFLCNKNLKLPQKLKTLELKECFQLKPREIHELRMANPGSVIAHSITRSVTSKNTTAYEPSPLSKPSLCARIPHKGPKKLKNKDPEIQKKHKEKSSY